MGYYDTSKFKGDLHWNPVEYKYMYGIRLDDIKVAGKSLGVCEGRENCLVTIDSGSSMNAFPHYAHKILKEHGLPSAGGNVECKAPSDFGEMTFVINGREYIIPTREWVWQANSLIQSKQHDLGPQLVQLSKTDS
jgi:hypothetical protein